MQKFFEKPKIITVWWDPLSVFPILCSIFTNPYSVLVLCSMPTPGKPWQEFRFLGLLHLMNHSKSTEKFHQFHYWFYEFYRAYPLAIQNQDTGFLISWPGHETHYDIKQVKVTSKKGNLGCLLTISDPVFLRLVYSLFFVPIILPMISLVNIYEQTFQRLHIFFNKRFISFLWRVLHNDATSHINI